MKATVLKEQIKDVTKAVIRRELLISYLKEEAEKEENKEVKDTLILKVGENENNLKTDKSWLEFLKKQS